ncbi:MAG: 4Fe-4S binding protein [Deltaproteobacteria bacterium]|nr:4Fe-4S binding protein [Deltaproteobacteria bacterium]
MRISKEKCVGCANCVPVCPVGAIYIGKDGLSEINTETCVECHNCYRSLSCEHLPPSLTRLIRKILKKVSLRFQPDPDVCPTEAIVSEELEWPRIVRQAFSDPMVTHESTGVHGRGTEEVKTNDVSHRIKEGDVGIVVEFGRPGIGTYFREVQKVTQVLAGQGATFEEGNPVAQMMTNKDQGDIREDILDEKVLSCIVEITVPLDETSRMLNTLKEVSKTVETVISIGVSTVCDNQGNDAVKDILIQQGYEIGWAKLNLGLGRVTNATFSSGGNQ